LGRAVREAGVCVCSGVREQLIVQVRQRNNTLVVTATGARSTTNAEPTHSGFDNPSDNNSQIPYLMNLDETFHGGNTTGGISMF